MKSTHKKGSVLVLALLLSTLIITITFTLVSTNSKEFVRQNILKNSYAAFNIVDTALECALYYNHRLRQFSYTSNTTAGRIFCPQWDRGESTVERDLYSFDKKGNEYSIKGYQIDTNTNPDANANEKSCRQYDTANARYPLEYACPSEEGYDERYGNRYVFYLARRENVGGNIDFLDGEPCAKVLYSYELHKKSSGNKSRKYIDVIGYSSCSKDDFGRDVQTGNVFRTLTVKFF